jgi:hypothetical protein
VVNVISAIAIGDALTIDLRTPTPLFFDTATIGVAADLGFKVLDDTGTLALSAGKATGGKVTWRLNRLLGANPRAQEGRPRLSRSAAAPGGASAPADQSIMAMRGRATRSPAMPSRFSATIHHRT